MASRENQLNTELEESRNEYESQIRTQDRLLVNLRESTKALESTVQEKAEVKEKELSVDDQVGG